MSVRLALILMASLLLVFAAVAQVPVQQSVPPKADSTIVFGTLKQPMMQTQTTIPRNSWGIDLLVSTNGFGMGTFYRHEYTENLSGYLDFSISEAKDDDEKEFIDYFGNTFTPGKINRFLVLPLYVGVQQRLFSDEIVDNFRPYVNAAVGPTMIFVFPYQEEYFSALGKGRPKYTVGGYIGLGAYFGSERSSLLGMNIRYYFIPFPGGLESLENVPPKKQFGGFYITLNFGSAW
ncbi:MAG: hypothetical protein HYR76_11535 [Ignavibacteria bacterium]|nr:hypothetical protein [Ignavibacteria bacterium]